MHIITGDFNAHNPLWSDTDKLCAIGTQVQYWIDNNNLVIHNTGKPTRLDPNRNSTSAIDLTITTTNISTQTQWHVHDDNWGSDHLPIFIDIQQKPLTEESTQHNPTWSYNRADWQEYQKLGTLIDTTQMEHHDINKFNNTLTKAIVTLANKTIPKTKAYNKPSVPWWNKGIQIKRQKRKQLLRKSANIQNYSPNIELPEMKQRSPLSKQKPNHGALSQAP